MKFRILVLVLAALMSVSALYAERTPGFSMSAFCAAVPDSSADAVFSPFAFELDCVAIGEGFGPLEKAKYIEALGALVGFDNIYPPIIEKYVAGETNDFSLISGRAFLTPALQLISPKYRTFLQHDYGVQSCPFKPTSHGAECYLKATMEGTMEDFAIPEDALDSRRVSFVDLECFKVFWSEPFPTANSRKLAFTRPDGSRIEVETMIDIRPAELWQTERFTMLRLPMTGGAFFYAVLPAENVPLSAIRDDFTAARLNTSLVVIRSITEDGIFRGPVAVVLPKLRLDTMVDLAPAFTGLKLPLGGFKEIYQGEEVSLASVRQRTRFELDERGPGGKFLEKKSTEQETRVSAKTRKFICNRPFLFFVCHEATRTIPVAGIFAGGVK